VTNTVLVSITNATLWALRDLPTCAAGTCPDEIIQCSSRASALPVIDYRRYMLSGLDLPRLMPGPCHPYLRKRTLQPCRDFQIELPSHLKSTALKSARSCRTRIHVRGFLVQLCARCTWEARRRQHTEVSSSAERISVETTQC
jgi:hypothetical protein